MTLDIKEKEEWRAGLDAQKKVLDTTPDFAPAGLAKLQWISVVT
jgi:hypothetical protein